jgi:nucleoside-diphosphate-sugar epimerase
MAEATVIGARGFIGSALVRRLSAEGIEVATIGRGDPLPRDAGHLYFCAGLTADFRTRLHETIEAHVTLISHVLQHVAFGSLTYLSSTRVYQRSARGDEEAPLTTCPSDPSDLYNLSKLTGEAICLAHPQANVRVVRLSNIFGADDPSPNFLNAVVGEAKAEGAVTIQAGANAAKDYLSVEDAAAAILRVPTHAKSRILNIAGGRRIANREIGSLLEKLIGVVPEYGSGVPPIVFPEISNQRMRDELGVTPEPFENAFARFVEATV